MFIYKMPDAQPSIIVYDIIDYLNDSGIDIYDDDDDDDEIIYIH